MIHGKRCCVCRWARAMVINDDHSDLYDAGLAYSGNRCTTLIPGIAHICIYITFQFLFYFWGGGDLERFVEVWCFLFFFLFFFL